ncbi:hypothetical protein ACFYP7_31600 [Micromonospora arida]|uniref:hypothetical protein n=1 Tax=Micromonospora arida TaxID=2203715 RepID=UPI0036B2E401
MKFKFDVGVQERYEVTFSFSKVWGGLSILVDGQPVRQELRVLSVELVKRYEFVVGQEERHSVLIEKERKQLFAGFRPQQIRAYVDGHLVAEHTA